MKRLIILFQEVIIGFVAVSVLFFWDPSLSKGLLLFTILLGVIVYRPQFEKKIESMYALSRIVRGILRKPCTLILVTVILANQNRNLQSALGIISSYALIASVASISFLIFRKLREFRENLIAVSIAAVMLLLGWLFPSALTLPLFANSYLPSFWFFEIASGDLFAFLLVGVLSLWLFRLRHRFDRND